MVGTQNTGKAPQLSFTALTLPARNLTCAISLGFTTAL